MRWLVSLFFCNGFKRKFELISQLGCDQTIVDFHLGFEHFRPKSHYKKKLSIQNAWSSSIWVGPILKTQSRLALFFSPTTKSHVKGNLVGTYFSYWCALALHHPQRAKEMFTQLTYFRIYLLPSVEEEPMSHRHIYF